MRLFAVFTFKGAEVNNNDLCYFPHSAYLRQDHRIMEMIVKYKNEGYACYFILLEKLRLQKNPDFHLKNTDAIISSIAFEMGVARKWLLEFISSLVELELLCFSENKDYIYSPLLIDDLSELIKRREFMAKIGSKGGKKTQENKRSTASKDQSVCLENSSKEENSINKPQWKVNLEKELGRGINGEV